MDSRNDYGPVRFVETVLLILSVLSLGAAFISMAGVFVRSGSEFFAAAVAGSVVLAAVFYSLYIVVTLSRDTNEKMNALWRSRETPPEVEFPKCRIPGCENSVYSQSTGLCREHYREAHGEKEERPAPPESP